MKRLRHFIMLFLMAISFVDYAFEPKAKDLDEIQNLLKYAQLNNLINEQVNSKMDECSNNGNEYCSLTLGLHYFRKKNYSKAISYLNKVDHAFANNNNKEFYPASFYLGIMYLRGLGAEKDQEKSLQYFKQCASSGEAVCAFMISGVYSGRWFKNHDSVTPYAWLLVAEKLGMREIPGPQNTNISLREGVKFTEESLSPDEITKGNNLANKICNNIPICSNLGHIIN